MQYKRLHDAKIATGDHVHMQVISIAALRNAWDFADIPLSKAVAGVHVGMIGDSVIISPSLQEQSESKLDLIIAGTADAILMIEGFCNFLTDEQMIQAGI